MNLKKAAFQTTAANPYNYNGFTVEGIAGVKRVIISKDMVLALETATVKLDEKFIVQTAVRYYRKRIWFDLVSL